MTPLSELRGGREGGGGEGGGEGGRGGAREGGREGGSMCDKIQGGVLYMFVYVHIQVYTYMLKNMLDPQISCILKGWHSD